MREGEIEGVVGQWSVNHRHGVMTRLSFQRLHRRKSSVRNYRPLSPPRPYPPPLLVPEHPLPERTTAWFLLQESIRWLQESEGFYVKILQKIMARYTFLQRGIALHSLSLSFFFLTSSSVFCLDITLLSSHLLCTSAFESFDRITMHRECIPLIASPSRSTLTGGRKLVEKKFILVGDSRARTRRQVFPKQVGGLWKNYLGKSICECVISQL